MGIAKQGGHRQFLIATLNRSVKPNLSEFCHFLKSSPLADTDARHLVI